ncbi:hypothetical protein [Desulfobacterium sp. N47]|uniref:Uncharacterized protein n=1 Tax=uncultured Desulfobacterium sp. TaxID=201089 RepID=E1YKE2_9BACT|nr:unknown protein [uncultured Desulfobacterium sp.]
MTPHFKRLEFKCKCINISTTYATGPILWPDSASEFEVGDDVTTQIGHYRTWADNIDPDCLREARKEIEQRVESFMLGMRFLGNAKFSQVDERLSYVTEAGEEYQITSDMDVEAIIRRSKGEEFNYGSAVLPSMTCRGSGFTSPVPFPQRMPSVPLVLKRHILNVIQAEELDGYSEHYEDEQLKRWFLVVEELEVEISSQEYKDLRSARNFISHPMSRAKETIAFLKREIPSSVYLNSDKKEEARYSRDNPTHRAVVSKYQTVARSWAKKLIEREILLKGGYIRP